MLKSTFILNIFIAGAFISMQGINHTNYISATTTIKHHIETREKPSLLQKLKAFVCENKQLFIGVFALSILAMYPDTTPIFIEWTLVNLISHALGNRNSHISVNFNPIYPSYYPTYWSHRPFW